MEKVRNLVVGAGVSGLAFAVFAKDDDTLIVEAEDEIGGYCRTVRRDGFVWDYSGHFFHFRDPEIERHLVDRMRGQRVLRVEKRSKIRFADGYVDFPFQKNIHQLPREDFLDCLVELYFREDREPTSFRDMLYVRFGRGIAERFLVPYNEKLYATDLDRLDVEAMGRFFPHASVAEIIRNFRDADNRSYNATFTYPEGGAIQYVEALASDLDRDRIRVRTRVEAIDLERRIATTNAGDIAFERLISAMPFDRLLAMTGVPHDPGDFTYNKVEVFNLGFDRKGPEGIHWIYYPQRDVSFYRIGFYDNIFGTDRMSLYVEIGRRAEARVDPSTVETTRARVLADLERVGIVAGHRLVAEHHVVLDPAYVHITGRSNAEVARLKAILARSGVYSIGRYGSWTYCSIEDNIIEAKALAAKLTT